MEVLYIFMISEEDKDDFLINLVKKLEKELEKRDIKFSKIQSLNKAKTLSDVITIGGTDIVADYVFICKKGDIMAPVGVCFFDKDEIIIFDGQKKIISYLNFLDILKSFLKERIVKEW